MYTKSVRILQGDVNRKQAGQPKIEPADRLSVISARGVGEQWAESSREGEPRSDSKENHGKQPANYALGQAAREKASHHDSRYRTNQQSRQQPAVLADRIEHHGLVALGSDFPKNVNALGFELLKMIQGG